MSPQVDTEKAEPRHVEENKLEEGGVAIVDPNEGIVARRAWLKIDAVLVPLSTLLYLAAYLDRGNIGNARLQGLEEQALSNNDTHYSIALMMFYITYIVGNTPGTLIAKKYPANKIIGIGCIIWSIAATAMAGAHNEAGIYVARLFIGVGESLFGVSIALWLSYWYTRRQFAQRVGFYICGGSLAGAFSGLIAFGVQHINSHIRQWRILFLVEGLPSLILGLIVFFLAPNRPQHTHLLTEEQRAVVCARLTAEHSNEGEEGIDWRAVRRAATDWKVYAISYGYWSMNINLGSVGGFLPTIVKGLGYTNAEAQLYTVPPYAVAFAYTLMVTYVSDRWQSRGIPLAATFCVGVVGWAILLAIPAAHPSGSVLHARYFGCICIVIAGYSEIPLLMSWQGANNPNQSQRAYAFGIMNSISQCGSVLSSFMFPSKEGPQYEKGITINLVFQSTSIIMAIALSLWLRHVNRRRDRLEGGSPVAGQVVDVMIGFDNAKGFRYSV